MLGKLSYIAGYLNHGGMRDIVDMAFASSFDSKFAEYVSTHNKGYGTQEEYMFRQ